jgi:glutamate-1-semialdehyde 2,1-aminomutase
LTEYNDPESAKAAIHAGRDTIGAVIVEPMIGAGGCIAGSPNFLAGLRDATSQTGSVLIFDEVMTSRHAAGGLQAYFGITPDMTTLGKYIAGGMTFGAFGGRAAIMDQFDAHKEGALFHSGTFNNNVLSMATGVIAMDHIFTPTAADGLFQRGETLRGELNDVCEKHGLRMHFSGLGSMMQPHFRNPPISRPYQATASDELLRELFFLDMVEAGIYIARRGMVALSLAVGDAQCREYVTAVDEFCSARGSLIGSA